MPVYFDLLSFLMKLPSALIILIREEGRSHLNKGSGGYLCVTAVISLTATTGYTFRVGAAGNDAGFDGQGTAFLGCGADVTRRSAITAADGIPFGCEPVMMELLLWYGHLYDLPMRMAPSSS